MSDLSKKLGKKIKQIREMRGIKQFALAEKLNMEPSNLTRIENGYQFPKEENLMKIAEVLNVEVKELFSFGAEMSKKDVLKKINDSIQDLTSQELFFLYNFLTFYKSNKESEAV